MIDVLPYIAEQLGSIADVELSFNDCRRSLPCIILSELDNSASVVLSGTDRYSLITLQLDIYDRDEETVRGIAAEVNEILAAKGIRRNFSQFLTDEDVPRMCMRYRFGVDEATGRTVSL